MVQTVDETEKLTITNSNSGGKMVFLTEDGLYEVLMQSRKPIAKQFKAEVKAILKSIRRHGAYLTPAKIEEVLLNPDTIIQLATSLKEEREKTQALKIESAQKDKKIAELEPKANYVDWILKSQATMNINAIAKDYGMSAKSMNKLLHELKVQYRQDRQWLLYKPYQNKGYVHSETIDFERSDGRADTRLHTKWTQAGRLFLYEILKKNGVVPMIEREPIKKSKGA